MTRGSSDNYRDLILRVVQEDPGFLRLTLGGPTAADKTPCRRIIFRPVTLRNERRLQVQYEQPTQNRVKNLEPGEEGPCLRETLQLPFTRIDLQRQDGDVHIRITKKGRVLMSRAAPSRPAAAPAAAHDRAKVYPLPGDRPDPFLQAIGLQDEQGRLRASLRDKFRQINGFIQLLAPLLPERAERPLFLVDCGCGSAWLTFALYHYLRHLRGLPARATGVDVKPEVMAKCRALRDRLQWPDLEFETSSIAAYQPREEPDLVLSLHACDTATDEALARGVLWNSRLLVAALCCQHELHHQLAAPLWTPLLRQGILRERLADLLTDTFRALLLRIMGYRVQVVEFVSAEATPKNLMIRAERGLPPGDPAALKEYLDLKMYWNVTPCLEALLGARFTALLHSREIS